LNSPRPTVKSSEPTSERAALKRVPPWAFALATLLAACGGQGSTTTPTPALTCSTLPNATTILIVNNAVCPQTLMVSPGSRVLFINNDSRQHEMFSDPHPEHTNCVEINQVGHLDPGQQRETGNLNTVRSCGFHDHINDQVRALQGTIMIR
jgi:plastocyanin